MDKLTNIFRPSPTGNSRNESTVQHQANNVDKGTVNPTVNNSDKENYSPALANVVNHTESYANTNNGQTA